MYEQLDAETMRAGFARALLVIGQTTNSARSIMACESAKRGYTVAEMRSPKRTFDISHARQEVMEALHLRTDLSLTQIGRMFNRDHTTVLHGLRAVAKRRAMS